MRFLLLGGAIATLFAYVVDIRRRRAAEREAFEAEEPGRGALAADLQQAAREARGEDAAKREEPAEAEATTQAAATKKTKAASGTKASSRKKPGGQRASGGGTARKPKRETP
jgi:hypothetical protein